MTDKQIIMFKEIGKMLGDLQIENSKLKQTLTEIKEIAEWHTTKADNEDVQEDMKQILQKISECEVTNDMENN